MNHTVVVTNDFPPRAGGIQSFVHGLVSRMDPTSVTVFAPSWRDSASFDADQDFEVVRFPGTLMLPEPRVTRQAAALVRDRGASQVLFGAAAPLGLISPSLRRSGAENIVAITHGHEAGWAGIPGMRQVLRSVGKRTDRLTFLGEYTRNRIASALRPADADRMRRLFPGVDDEAFHPRNRAEGLARRKSYGLADRPVVVCVSRLMPRKGQDQLIASWRDVQRAVPEAALLIVGGGPYREKLQQLVAEQGLDHDVVITGSVPWEQLPACYAAGDIFVMPCRTRNRGLDVEGLGIVYLEASATGLPVIAGNSGGAPDAVLAGRTGFVVDGTDSAEVVSRIVQLLNDEQLRTDMGMAGRAWIEQQWRWDHIIRRLQLLLAGQDPDVLAAD